MSEVNAIRSHLVWLIDKHGIGKRDLKGSFDARLRLQKTSYLLKHLGIPPFKDYDFNLYLRGPYSPSLSHEYYNLEGIAPSSIELSESNLDLLRWFTSKSSRDMEIATSILLINEFGIRGGKLSDSDVYSILIVSKPWITIPMFKKTTDELREQGLIK